MNIDPKNRWVRGHIIDQDMVRLPWFTPERKVVLITDELLDRLVRGDKDVETV